MSGSDSPRYCSGMSGSSIAIVESKGVRAGWRQLPKISVPQMSRTAWSRSDCREFSLLESGEWGVGWGEHEGVLGSVCLWGNRTHAARSALAYTGTRA